MSFIQDIYRHYSGKEYEVIGIAHHSETLEKLVVYSALYDCKSFGKNALWVRPFEMFFENIEVQGELRPRFELIEQPEG